MVGCQVGILVFVGGFSSATIHYEAELPVEMDDLRLREEGTFFLVLASFGGM
jgi:hypothetical protein